MAPNFVWIAKIIITIIDRWEKSRILLDSSITRMKKKRALLLTHLLDLQKHQMNILMAINVASASPSYSSASQPSPRPVLPSSPPCSPPRKRWAFDRSSTFWETECQDCTGEMFKKYFRMSRNCFSALCNSLGSLRKEDTVMRKAVPLEKRVAVSLYVLGSSESYRSISNLFAIGHSTTHEILYKFCAAVWRDIFVDVFPLTTTSIQENVQRFFGQRELPQCLGVIGGFYIQIRAPGRKAQETLILLALVDARYVCSLRTILTMLKLSTGFRGRFLSVNVGWPGHHDVSTVYQQSQLNRNLEDCGLLYEMSETINGVQIPVYVLGNSTFHLAPYLMTPYSLKEATTPQQRIFNVVTSRNHRIIENSFKKLKARFQRLSNEIDCSCEKAVEIIKACCALHNFLCERNDVVESVWLEAVIGEDALRPKDKEIVESDNTSEAEQIRTELAAYFYENT